jgi:CRISPR-associated RAMP protein (TIGR02581 family)
MKFMNRWKIIGTLTTKTPLRIGDGDAMKASKRGCCDYLVDEKAKTPVDVLINLVATDKDKKPYIPASAIKGNLRAWAKNVLTTEEIDIIFGSTDPKLETAKAGKVQFSNAYVVDSEITDKPYMQLAGWNPKRFTAVSVGIAVDRKTRTASDKKLFYQEYVPEGITFKFELSGNDYEVTDKENLKGDEVLLKLLTFLEGFNHLTNPVCVGAETVGLDKSWGRLTWKLGEVKRTNTESLKTWFESNDLNAEIPFELVETKDWKIDTPNTNNQSLAMSLSLEFLDDFLVNDPSKTKTKEEQKDADNKKPNHSPLRNKDGNPILPKSSIKGAIRSQAEKILRTMAISQNENLTDEQLKKVACYPDDMQNACQPIKKADEVKGLCLACQLFGASGWKSPVSFTDFTATSFQERRREFVAIDRFTGGVSGSGKFNAEVAHRPLLSGKISIYFERLEKCEAKDWAIGLLALTFRDLIEGDIRLGFGRAKGFGEIHARIDNLESIENLFGKTKDKLIDAVKALESTIGGKINVIS